MAIKGYFFNAVKDSEGNYDRLYNAQDVTSYLDKIVGSGVFPNPSTNLQVMASSGMNIVVKAGQGWINGHKMINTADMPLTIAGSDVLLNRIDRVIFYADYTTREMGIEVLQGTSATTPVAPALTRNDSRIEYSLATITINKQVTAISQSMITDTRPNSNVCGWVQGLVQQADTSTLFTQWETAYTEFMTTMQAWMTAQQNAYASWFDTLTEDLQVNTYLANFEKYASGESDEIDIQSLDMTGYTYESSDIFFVFINGLAAVPDVDYLLDTRSTPVQIHLNLVNTSSETNEVYIRVLKSKVGDPVNTQSITEVKVSKATERESSIPTTVTVTKQ